MRRTLILIAPILILIVPQVLQAQERAFPGVQKLMTEEEFRDAGLEQLDADELEALNAWLIRYTAGESAVIRSDKTIVEVQEAKKEFEIVSRIAGDFDGWSGKTIFRLENGQTWRQRLSGRYSYSGPPNPEVRITKNLFGFYELTVVETGKTVGVKTVR